MLTPSDFMRLSSEADEAGIRLEIVRGISVWEPKGTLRHQMELGRVMESIQPPSPLSSSACESVVVPDLSFLFPDGSHKRPDICILCRDPDELDTEVTLLPEAVIEILSEDYHAKDLLIGVPFYQQVGVKDIVVFDPRTGDVRHWQQGQPERAYVSPVPLTFLCGCTATV